MRRGAVVVNLTRHLKGRGKVFTRRRGGGRRRGAARGGSCRCREKGASFRDHIGGATVQRSYWVRSVINALFLSDVNGDPPHCNGGSCRCGVGETPFMDHVGLDKRTFFLDWERRDGKAEACLQSAK